MPRGWNLDPRAAGVAVGREEGRAFSIFYFPTLFHLSQVEILEFARRENPRFMDLTKVKANINSELGASNWPFLGQVESSP